MQCSCVLRILISLNLIFVVATDYPFYREDCTRYPCSCCDYSDTSGLTKLDINLNCQEPNNSGTLKTRLDSYDADYSIYHTSSCLSKLPGNICDFPTIKAIQLQGNEITEVPNLSCLAELVFLDLSHNKISTLKAGIFDSLAKLRRIDLQNNEINIIEAGVFHSNLNSLLEVHLEYNQITKFDVWAILNITHRFCSLVLNNNLINELTNNEDRKMPSEGTHGPGLVDFRFNKMQIWISKVVKSLGLTDISKLGVFFKWGFDLRDNPWICDCSLYDFMSIVKNSFLVIYRDYFNVSCHEPEKKLFMELELEKLVCNITEECPSDCLCQDQPAFSRFVVDCQQSGLTELPVHLPHRSNLYLKFSNNSINRLDNRKYLKKVLHLDLAHNNISFISPESIENLNFLRYLNLNNNNLEYLPKNIQKLRLSELDIDNNIFICNCSNVWMSKWVKNNHFVKDDTNISCFVGENKHSTNLQDINSEILGCRTSILSINVIISIVVLIVIVIIMIIICIYFRYELLTIYYLKFRFNRKIPDQFKYDVFISCDEENDEDRIWIQENILRLLDHSSLKCYVSFRDGMGGEITVDKNITTIHNSHIVLALTSDTYISNSKTMMEVHEIYDHIIAKNNGKLILIKRGEFQSSKIKNGYIRSLFRIKLFLSSNDKNLSYELIKRMNLDPLEYT